MVQLKVCTQDATSYTSQAGWFGVTTYSTQALPPLAVYSVVTALMHALYTPYCPKWGVLTITIFMLIKKDLAKFQEV